MVVGAVECSLDGEETVVLCDDATADTAETQDQNNSITTEEGSCQNNKLTEILETDTADDDEESLMDLSWRLDPVKSLSDWTIHVHAFVPRKIDPLTAANPKSNLSNERPKARTDVYHVHKSVLGVGPRRSRFFAVAFAQHEAEKKKQIENLQQKQTSDMLFFKELFEESIDIVKNRGFSTVKCGSRSAGNHTHSSQLPITVLEMEAPAAEAFPALLDYLYAYRIAALSKPTSLVRESADAASSHQQSPEDLVNITTHSATALHHLAVRLKIKPLQSIASEFFKSDVSIDNLMVYYTHARIFDDAPVLKQAANVLAASILDMEQKMVIYFLQALDAEFFLMVLERITEVHAATRSDDEVHDLPDKTLSIRLSLLVAIYCNLHRDELGGARLTMFERLTDEQWIPDLDVKAAQVLLDIEQELKDDCTLTSLKRRCIEIISFHWDTALLSVEDDNDPAGNGSSGRIYLPPLNGEALCHFTLMALTRAKQQLDAGENQGASMGPKPVSPDVSGTSLESALVLPPPLPVTASPVSPKIRTSYSKGDDDELLGQIIVSAPPVHGVADTRVEVEPLSE
jgi:hypothetical protein